MPISGESPKGLPRETLNGLKWKEFGSRQQCFTIRNRAPLALRQNIFKKMGAYSREGYD